MAEVKWAFVDAPFCGFQSGNAGEMKMARAYETLSVISICFRFSFVKLKLKPLLTRGDWGFVAGG